MKNMQMDSPQFQNMISDFMDALGLEEPPMGIFYTNDKPDQGFTPKPQTPIPQLETESKGEINWISCVLSKVRRARIEKTAAWFDQTHYGCLGGAFFMGFKKSYEAFEPALLANGIPGKFDGERYVNTPQTGQQFYEAFQPPPASAPYLVIQPLDHFKPGESPETVVFFVDSEIMVGLNALTVFLTGDINAIQMPFGVGCCGLISWPRNFLNQGKTKAVVSCFDVSSRKYHRDNELTYVVPFDLFLKMLAEWPKSAISTKAWQQVQKKIRRRHRIATK